MKRTLFVMSCALAAFLPLCARASWYWPFGSDDDERAPRLSELMEPASVLIDEASDLAGEGKVSEAVEKYRAALKELDRIEKDNPARAKTAEFSTLRIKRAYVNAAIDSMLMRQAKENARVVAVSDTAALERKLAEERAGKPAPGRTEKREKPGKKAVVRRRPERPFTPMEEIMNSIGSKRYESAATAIDGMLRKNPNDVAALNLRAAMEAAKGEYDAAERTLDRAIQSNPRAHHSYYNMAVLYLQTKTGGKDGARRYYETGRTLGGPKDPELEEALKK